MEKELNLVEFVGNILGSIRKYWWLFVLVFLAGIGTSWLMHVRNKTVYQTSAVVYTNFTDFSIRSVESMMELMNEYVMARRHKVVAEAFAISPAAASSISEISVEVPDVKDNTFFLTLSVTTPKHLNDIETGILRYFNKNKTKLTFDRLKVRRYEQMNALIDNEVHALDSIWENRNWNESTDLGTLVQTKINLQDKKSSFEYTIDRIEMGFSYVQPFNKQNLIVSSPGLKKYLFLGGFGSLVIIGLILILIELRRALQQN